MCTCVLSIFVIVSILWYNYVFVFFFKQKTAYVMRISDWSSDVCSSDLKSRRRLRVPASWISCCGARGAPAEGPAPASVQALALGDVARGAARLTLHGGGGLALALLGRLLVVRSEEHTSELQSLMRI